MEKDGVVLPIFNGWDYNRWKARLKLFLEYKNCIDVLDEKADKTIKKADCRARNYILSSLSDPQFDTVCKETSARSMIDILDSVYGRKNESLQILVQQELFELKYNETLESASEFLSKFEMAVNKQINW